MSKREKTPNIPPGIRKHPKFKRVMKEFDRGLLTTGSGHTVTLEKQALAIATNIVRKSIRR